MSIGRGNIPQQITKVPSKKTIGKRTGKKNTVRLKVRKNRLY